MATYLLDTTTFSHLMRDHRAVRARVAALSGGDRLTTCATVWGEVLYGIERLPIGNRRAALDARARQVFSAVACEPISQATAEHYACLERAAEQAGTSLDENDLWIAAAARSLGATLVTTDSDYSRLTGLTLEDWTSGASP